MTRDFLISSLSMLKYDIFCMIKKYVYWLLLLIKIFNFYSYICLYFFNYKTYIESNIWNFKTLSCTHTCRFVPNLIHGDVDQYTLSINVKVLSNENILPRNSLGFFPFQKYQLFLRTIVQSVWHCSISKQVNYFL